jgi:hypothetical protein
VTHGEAREAARRDAAQSEGRLAYRAAEAIADRYGISYRQPGTSHVTFRSPRGDKLTVPARRSINPVYVRQFLALLEALEAANGDQT